MQQIVIFLILVLPLRRIGELICRTSKKHVQKLIAKLAKDMARFETLLAGTDAFDPIRIAFDMTRESHARLMVLLDGHGAGNWYRAQRLLKIVLDDMERLNDGVYRSIAFTNRMYDIFAAMEIKLRAYVTDLQKQALTPAQQERLFSANEKLREASAKRFAAPVSWKAVFASINECTRNLNAALRNEPAKQ